MRGVFDAPVAEVSGACFAGNRLVIVGDARPEVAWTPWHDGPTEWTVTDISSLPGAPPESGQFEAVEHVRDDIVVVLCEEPALLIAVDIAAWEIVGHWRLTVELKGLRKHWRKDDNSLGEGLIFGPDRVFVIKEKDPPAIIEFGPAGLPSLGEFVPGTWVPQESGVLTALEWWRIDDYGDISDACVVDNELWVLSDQDRCFGRIGEKPTKLPKALSKPEGLTLTPEGQWLVAVDNDDGSAALHLIPRP